MRRKLFEFSHRVFDTYELLEMLLYYTNRLKDTNPVSKALLSDFGSLDALLSADEERLTHSYGCGRESAALIRTVDEIHSLIGTENEPFYFELSEYADISLQRLEERKENTIILFSLDSSGRLLREDEIYELDYSSAGVRPGAILGAAVSASASAVIIAHNHPYSSIYPTEGDLETNNLIIDTLSQCGITLMEHFIVSGKTVRGFMHNTGRSPSPKIQGTASRDGERALLARLLSFVSKNNVSRNDTHCKTAASKAELLISKYPNTLLLLCADATELSKLLTESEVCLLLLTSALMSRRLTEAVKPGKIYSEQIMKGYIAGLFFGASVENVYLISLSASGAFIASDLIGEGTVNGSDIIPRRILDTAARRGAARLILAHNHPRGIAEPSEEDIIAKDRLGRLIVGSRITELSHYVTAGINVKKIN